MLQVTDLKKTYSTGDEALKGVTASVEGSETVAMIGPSGAGKSTFIRCINRLTEPSSGEIHLGDTELISLDDDALRSARRDIGMIFQEYNLVERLTVMENVLTGRLAGDICHTGPAIVTHCTCASPNSGYSFRVDMIETTTEGDVKSPDSVVVLDCI